MTDLVDSSSRLKTRVSTPDESLRIMMKSPEAGNRVPGN